MKAFQKLIRESWKFYLAAMGLMLFFVIGDSVLICRENRIAFMETSVEQTIESEILRTEENGGIVEVPEAGRNLADVFSEKAGNFQLMGFLVTIIGIIVLLVARKFNYTDLRAREFYKLLPVKEGTAALYDYMLILSVILTGALVQGAILTGALTNYNRTWVTLAAGNPEGAAAKAMIHAANEYTLTYMLCYFLFVVVMYMWIYFGVTVTKNPVAGVFVSVAAWGLIYSIFVWYGMADFWLERDVVMEDGLSKGGHISTYIESFLSPHAFFANLDWESRMMVTAYNGYGYSIWLNVGAMVIFIILLAVLIFLAANKRELAKGKLFYFPVLDYPFSLMCGLWVCLLLLDYDWGIFAPAAGFLSAVCLCLSIHPHSGPKSDNWEVK